tara:strand:- start:19343 stop:20428 length:1086 start_codon:yes stop_codon:yes gene_type:complete
VSLHQVKGSIEQQAADWFLLMNAEQIPEQDQLHAFLDWLQDPAAEAAYAECESAWELTNQLAADELITSASKDKQDHTGRNRTFASWLNLASLQWRWQQLHNASKLSLQAVCIALVLLTSFGVNQLFNNDLEIYQTAIGQQQAVTLRDGSLVTLNTASEIHVSYSDELRKIILARGEVLFDVAKDHTRPFKVIAGNGEITALGTIFNVRRQNQQHQVEVSLLEGEVEVSASLPTRPENASTNTNVPFSQTLLLQSNQRIRYSRDTISSVEAFNSSEKVTQWQDGQLSFSNASLADIIFEVNRYAVTQLVIEELQLRETRIDAQFVIGDTDTLLLALKETMGVKWSLRTDGILLYREKTDES